MPSFALLRAREPDLARQYEERLALVLDHLREWERVLVLFGAGSEEDASLAQDLGPVYEQAPAGPSVRFEL